MNIHNHLIPSQLLNTTPIKQGETTTAILKEKITNSKAVLIIRGQEYQTEFTNEIPQSEKITVKVLNISENKLQVESKEAIKSSPITQSNNRLQSIEIGKMISNSKVSDPILSIMNRKGLQPNITINNYIKEALSRNVNDQLVRLNKEVFNAVQNEVKVIINAISNETNQISIVAQVNFALNKISPFINKQSSDELNVLSKELNANLSLDKLQIVKDRLINVLQQVGLDIEVSVIKAGKENVFQTVSEKPNVQSENVIHQTREQVQQISTEEIEKNHEARQYLQLGKKQESNEKILQTLQQHKSESSLVDTNNSQTEKNVHNTNNLRQEVIQTNTSEAKLEKTPIQNKTEITKQEVDQWLNMITKQSKMGQALDLLQSEINKYPESAPVKKVIESMERAAQHVQSKKELAARKEIHETLQQIKPNLPSESTENHEMQTINVEMKSFIENSPLLASASKDIVVTKVTEKLAKATIDFKEVQRELVRNLNNVDNMLRTQHIQPQAKQLLESTIAKLDNSILKSEMMILSDMDTEKKLMQASSQLTEAKKFLSSGNPHEAQKIVQNVSKLLEKINWKPSEVKVMHYTSGLSEGQSVPHYEKHLTKTISNIANYSDMEYGSPREMFEKLRSMGLNYERDIGNYFASNKPEHQLRDLESNNLKYLLQKISSEDGTGKFSQQIEQTLSNITGQQLLSKSDHQANQQSMMFSLPVQLEQQMKNIKVFVNSKKDGQKVDWENCSLYFLIETPKLGEVGIQVSAADRKLSLTLKNNSYDFEQVAKPIGEKAIQKIEEIGYQVNGLKFTDLRKGPVQQEDRKEEQMQTDFKEYFMGKGMNFTI